MNYNTFKNLINAEELENAEISEETANEIILLNNEIIKNGFASELGIAESILRCIKNKLPIIKSNVLSNIRNDYEKTNCKNKSFFIHSSKKAFPYNGKTSRFIAAANFSLISGHFHPRHLVGW
mgnify:CR=1 FL=1